MPPPHLHPRSRMTSSLFATTVLASFFVVGLPHVLPCPAPRVALADGEMAAAVVDENGRRRRRRRRQEGPEVKDGGIVQFESASDEGEAEGEAEAVRRKKGRECPVPKPSGVVGELLGFKKAEVEGDSEGSRPRS